MTMRQAVSLVVVLSAYAGEVQAQLSAELTWAARFAGFQGSTTCAYGSAACNRCVHNVEWQFSELTRGSKRLTKTHLWQGRGAFASDVDDILVTNPDNGHIQGIARHSGQGNNFLVTHSGSDSNGAGSFLFSASSQPDGRVQDAPGWPVTAAAGDVTAVLPGATLHPGGLQGIGRYFLIANDGPPSIQFVDTNSAGGNAIVRALGDNKVASVAASQLAGGGYLLVTTNDSKYNNYRFWFTPSLTEPHIEQIWPAMIPSSGQPTLTAESQGSEGVSLITECGTGAQYMVGVQGEFHDISNIGDWTLHKITQAGAPNIAYRNRNSNDLHSPVCNTRAGGSAFAGPRGELALYCSQKGEDDKDLINGVKCGAAAASFFTGAFVFTGGILESFLGSSCNELRVGASSAVFTEHWPSFATSETPQSSLNQNALLDVHVTNTHGSETHVLVAFDSGSEQSIQACDTAPNESRVCNFLVPYGAAVRVISNHPPSAQGYTMFDDGYCSSNYGSATAPDGSIWCDLTAPNYSSSQAQPQHFSVSVFSDTIG